AVGGGGRGKAGRPVPAAGARQPDGAAAPSDAPRGGGVELGPAGRRRAADGQAADGVRGRRDGGGGRAGLRAARGGAVLAGGEVAGGERRRPLPDAADDPRVLRRAAGGGGRDRGDAGRARRLLPGSR